MCRIAILCIAPYEFNDIYIVPSIVVQFFLITKSSSPDAAPISRQLTTRCVDTVSFLFSLFFFFTLPTAPPTPRQGLGIRDRGSGFHVRKPLHGDEQPIQEFFRLEDGAGSRQKLPSAPFRKSFKIRTPARSRSLLHAFSATSATKSSPVMSSSISILNLFAVTSRSPPLPNHPGSSDISSKSCDDTLLAAR